MSRPGERRRQPVLEVEQPELAVLVPQGDHAVDQPDRAGLDRLAHHRDHVGETDVVGERQEQNLDRSSLHRPLLTRVVDSPVRLGNGLPVKVTQCG